MRYVLVILFFYYSSAFATKMCSQRDILQSNCDYDLANYNKDYLCNTFWADQNSGTAKPCCRLVHCTNYTGGWTPMSFANEWVKRKDGNFYNKSDQMMTTDSRGNVVIRNPCSEEDILRHCDGNKDVEKKCYIPTEAKLSENDEFVWDNMNWVVEEKRKVVKRLSHYPRVREPSKTDMDDFFWETKHPLNIKKVKTLVKFDIPDWFDDDRSSKLMGFSDGAADYLNSDPILKWMFGDGNGNLAGSCDHCPKWNSARIGYGLMNNEIILRGYIYNMAVRRSKEIARVKSGQCFLAEIGIDRTPNPALGLYVNGNYQDSKFSELTDGTGDNTTYPDMKADYFDSSYRYVIKKIGSNGQLEKYELIAPKTVIPSNNYFFSIPAFNIAPLNLLFPNMNGPVFPAQAGYIWMRPYHGGSVRPAKKYKLQLKLMDYQQM